MTGRQALGDLVEQQQPRAGAQDARHGQHLLLAARQPRALAAGALAQVGEHRVDLLDAHAARGQRAAAASGSPRPTGWRRCRAPRGSSRCPGARCGAWPCAMTSCAVHLDRALAAAGQAHDRAQRAGAPGAVAAEQRHHLALVDVEVHAVQHVRLAVPGVQVLDFEEASAAAMLSAPPVSLDSARCPCRPRSPPGSSTPARTALRPAWRRAAAR